MSSFFLGRDKENNQVSLNSDDLVTHAIIVGKSGSGKTSLLHVLVEEAAMNGVSSVVIDSKGDLTNLSLRFPELTSSEFEPWVPDGKDPKDEARYHIQGILDSGQNCSRVEDWYSSSEVSVYTPGLSGSKSINLVPDLNLPKTNIRNKAIHIVSTILSVIGNTSDPMVDPSYVFLTEMLLGVWKSNRNFPLEQWSGFIVNPPEYLQSIDGIHIDDFFPARDRMKLARALIGFRHQAAQWLEGSSIDMNSFLNPSGLPKVSIFTLRHLNIDDRMFFTSMFLSSLVSWMYQAPASSKLKALCVLDEAAGYLPPHPYSPPTKRPLSTLLSQGRAQGLGIVIGTQNPNDLDYKALSNVGTWCIGSLRERDLQRDLDSELTDRGIDSNILLNLPPRNFLLLTKDGKTSEFKARWALSYLRGPIESERFLQKNSGDITVEFDLLDRDSKPLDVAIRFSVDGELWQDATPVELKDLSNLETSPEGITYRYIWNSIADLGLNFVSGVRLAVHVIGYGTLDLAPIDVHNEII